MSYINKDKLIERMEAYRELWKEEEIDYIKAFPISDVAPVVRGHWVQDAGGWKCSECGDYLQTFVTPDEVEIHFCPTCGANMVLSYGDSE